MKRENEIIKKGSDVLRERCSVKYAWISEHGKAFALAEMCAVLNVSISGYRAWKRGSTPGRKLNRTALPGAKATPAVDTLARLGLWLEQAGFTPQARIRVRAMRGYLVITTE